MSRNATGFPESEHAADLPEHERNEQAEAFFAAIGATTRWGEPKAAYSPRLDIIVMPERGAFLNPESLYAVWAHEQLSLDRPQVPPRPRPQIAVRPGRLRLRGTRGGDRSRHGLRSSANERRRFAMRATSTIGSRCSSRTAERYYRLPAWRRKPRTTSAHSRKKSGRKRHEDEPRLRQAVLRTSSCGSTARFPTSTPSARRQTWSATCPCSASWPTHPRQQEGARTRKEQSEE